MASSALTPMPPQPADVSGQMGGMPFSGMGGMMDKKGGAGAPDPNGALRDMYGTLEKVIDQMAKMSEKFKPYADRAKGMLKAGVDAAAGESSQTTQMKPPAGPGGDVSQSFPG